MKSDCSHHWIENVTPVVCLWCGIQRVRTDKPRPRLKMPASTIEPDWAARKAISVRSMRKRK